MSENFRKRFGVLKTDFGRIHIVDEDTLEIAYDYLDRIEMEMKKEKEAWKKVRKSKGEGSL